MRKMLISLLILFSSVDAFSQTDISGNLEKYFKQVREKVYTTSPSEDLYSPENAQALLNLLKDYKNDSIPKTRLAAYYLVYKCAYKNSNEEIRNSAVFYLTQALKDHDSGNVGNVADWLSEFYSSDFNQASKDSLRMIVRNQASYNDRIIKLIGFVGLNDQIDYLKTNLTNGVYKTNKIIWAAHLALARLGVESEIDFCTNKVKSLAVNDDVVYELIPDLIYIRQRKPFDYVISILQSKDKNCFSANPENPQKILCGYRIMEYLAPVINNFPLELDSMGEIVTSDYEKALKNTQNWYKTHLSDYEIIKTTY